MKYLLCDDPWDEREIEAIQEVIASGRYTMGLRVQTYEEKFARKVGSKHAVMVSSGSAANLLAIAALVYSGKLPRGSEVIVPAVSWSTTYAPLEQYGMKLVFVDIDKDTLNIDVESLKRAVTAQTRLVLLVNLLGNPNEFSQILPYCRERDILVIEDNCESLGGTFEGKSLGTLGLLGTYSTFYSHHLCTMEGGVVVTDDDTLYEYLLSIRAHGWTRNLPENSTIYSKKNDPFYESYNFIVPGYNLRPLEMEGAIGCVQLDKMDRMIAARRINAAYFLQQMSAFEQVRCQKEVGQSSWFGFAIILQGALGHRRNEIVQKLSDRGIEVRPIVAGNFTRNKVISYMDYRIAGSLRNADEIHDCGFFIGNHSSDNSAQVDYFIQVFRGI